MTLLEFNRQFPDEETCRHYLEQVIWPNGRCCPHCRGPKSWPITSDSVRPGLYECAECGSQFTVTTKTPLHSTKLPLKTWLLALFCLTNSSKGISSVYLAKWIGTTQKTAWRMGHILRTLMSVQIAAQDQLAGSVEVDETYVGGPPRAQRGVTHKRGRGSRNPCVMVIVTRNAQARAEQIECASHKEMKPRLLRLVSPEAALNTDELNVYIKLGKEFAGHDVVTHSAGEYARGEVHSNTAESFNAKLERVRFGVFHHMSRLHLPKYLSEVVFQWNHRQPARVVIKNGREKTIWEPMPVLVKVASLLEHAVGIQLRRLANGGIIRLPLQQPLFGG
jgi:transposase-like protein